MALAQAGSNPREAQDLPVVAAAPPDLAALREQVVLVGLVTKPLTWQAVAGAVGGRRVTEYLVVEAAAQAEVTAAAGVRDHLLAATPGQVVRATTELFEFNGK